MIALMKLIEFKKRNKIRELISKNNEAKNNNKFVII